MAVTTVTGAVECDSLGATLMHEHLWRVSHCHTAETLEVFGTEARLAEDLRAFAGSGGRAVVEAPVYTAGRDPAALRDASLATGVKVVMSAGTGIDEEADLTRLSSHDLGELLASDLEHGVSGVAAGILTQIGTRCHRLPPDDERVLRALARAHRRTGAAVAVHAYASGVGLALVRLLVDDEGVDPGRVVVAHVDTFPSLAYYRTLLRRGVCLQFDALPMSDAVRSDDHRIPNLAVLVSEGYVSQLVLSCDVCGRAARGRREPEGYGYLLGAFASQLTEAGVNEEHLYAMTVLNPARVLDV